MPKMKTHRGAAKRLKRSGTGKLVRDRSFNRHIAEKKSSKRKRRLGRPALLADSDVKRARRMLGV